MRCEKIRDILKSGYLDNEISPKDKQHISDHLLQCPGCRRLEEELLAQRAIFSKAGRAEVPEGVWQDIRDNIVAERPSQDRLLNINFLKRLREFLSAPQPVMALTGALGAIILALIITGTFINKKQLASNGKISASFTDYSLSDQGGDSFNGLGTTIEEYFL